MPAPRQIILENPDLKHLHEDGFELSIKHCHLLVTSVPYVTQERKVKRGTLIFPLSLVTDTLLQSPKDHTAYFAGEKPSYSDGSPLACLINREANEKLADGLVSRFFFSSRPLEPDRDYYIKVRRYVDALSDQARVLEPSATAQTRRIVESEDDTSPFVYLDTNSARAGIMGITDKLRNLQIAIIGVGGTGSYVLDLVAKTPVKEIHLFDDDEYSLHNTYRSPGAPTREQLRARSLKVDYLREVYSRMHKGVVAHSERAGASTISMLGGMSFVFLCMEPGEDKAQVIDFLLRTGIPFTDTGLGVKAVSEKLIGIVNTITVTPKYKSHVSKVPLKAGGDNELYDSNIQIAELNALNAILAVIRWKKYFGFYEDDRNEHECSYTIGPNMLTNEEAGT